GSVARCRTIGESSLVVHDHAFDQLESRRCRSRINLGFSSGERDFRELSLGSNKLCPKVLAERDKLILGARAPSPAMSAKRETVTASRSLRLSCARSGGRGRPRSQY